MHVSRLIYARHQSGGELPQPARDRGARGYIEWKRAAVLEVRENEMGEAVLDYVIGVANGEVRTNAELKGQEDFIPRKRGVYASYVPREHASEFIAGYALHNDYSERSFGSAWE